MMLKAVFLDLAGVLYEGRRAIPRAWEAVARLQASSLTLRFVTKLPQPGHRFPVFDERRAVARHRGQSLSRS
ncbi:hypothetical protein A167_02049 [Alcanivorax sp. S71-1-4]|uniref:hypothetical protein n=1 Tax=Alcanivorax sp. S71-1-4 TaxID=1177159 RepID=UPI00135CEB83|nr:hypothetical protein [Alcanivorax sp. S71-1-4]KAF0809135.1 hypothetical protein A167_02049 [Alcanivorax sp. S71-1-4]